MAGPGSGVLGESATLILCFYCARGASTCVDGITE